MARIRGKSLTNKEDSSRETKDRLQEISDKVSASGFDSLTPEEVERLKQEGVFTKERPSWNRQPSIQEKIKNLIIEDLGKVWSEFIEGETHHFYDFFCWCPSCLYLYYKLIHKNSKIRKDHFFFTWLVLLAGGKFQKKYFSHNWNIVEDLWLKVTCEPLSFPNENERYRVFSKYKKVISKALQIRLLIFMYAPYHIKVFLAGDFRKVEGRLKSDKMFAEKAILYIKEKKEVSQRQLERRFSTRRKEEIELLLKELDSLSNFNWDKNKKKISYLEKSNSK